MTATVGVAVIEMPGRAQCTCALRDEISACTTCGGSGWLRRPPGPACSECTGHRLPTMRRAGWHETGWPHFHRLPLYVCDLGHRTAIRYTLVPE